MNREEKDHEREFEKQLLELTATFREEEIKHFLKIEDAKLDEAIQKKKNGQTFAMVEQLGEQTDDKEREIRRSKQKKDRKEEIKIKALIRAAKIRKEFEAKLKKEKRPSLSPSPRRHNSSSKK
jgi:DNA-directed RNA polymerase specialized sigma subunit